jgi:hypothetical protein
MQKPIEQQEESGVPTPETPIMADAKDRFTTQPKKVKPIQPKKVKRSLSSSWADSISTLVIASVVGFFSYHAANYSASVKIAEILTTSARVKVLDIPSIAKQWKELSEEEIQLAVLALVKSYTDAGYLVIDSTSVLGFVGPQYEVKAASVDQVKAELGTEK